MSTGDTWYYLFEVYTALPSYAEATTTSSSTSIPEWSKYSIAVSVVNKLIHYFHKEKVLCSLPFSRILRIENTPLEYASSQTIGNPRAALTISVVGQRLGETVLHPHRLDTASDRDQLVDLISAYVSCDLSPTIPQFPVVIHRGPGRKSGHHFASSRHFVIIPYRLLVYRTESSTLPLHTIYLIVDMERKGDKKLLVRSREREYTFIWKNQTEREVWYSLIDAEINRCRQLEAKREQKIPDGQKQPFGATATQIDNPSATIRLSKDYENDKDKSSVSRRTSLTSSSISGLSASIPHYINSP